ncbi:MAG: methyltransferase domain-containing protein [Parvularculaceae bacterium]|jgi:SAM-dependent methyltransferase|nr:methyltransferase domain-containing protein [Parvularculaceae bacterium]
MDLKEENAIGGDPMAHWYYVAKHRAILDLIGKRPYDRALDVGAGSGVFSRMLLAEGMVRHATCVDPNYPQDWIGQRRSDRIAFKRSVSEVDAELILMIDVIEHVDDDVGLVADYARRAPAGARFVVSVPAFNFLWSGHDEFLEHRRRYTLDQLQGVVAGAGLHVVDTRYFFGMLFPAVAALRLAGRALKGDKPATSAMRAAPRWLNNALIAVHEIERAALFPVNRFAGVTAFCLAEKRSMALPSAAA